jgi:hypothetical protein
MRTFVLTLWQPWATLLAYGIKQNETRVKPANYQPEDRILIHAAKAKDTGWRNMTDAPGSIFQRSLNSITPGLQYNDLPFGALVGEFKVKEFTTVRYIDDRDFKYIPVLKNGAEISEDEELLGDYTPGRSIWMGTNHRPLLFAIEYANGQGYNRKLKGLLESHLIFK